MAKGMPLIGHVYPKGESVPVDKRTAWENIAYCVRSACELGMDIVKTTYTGDPESMAKVVACVPSTFRVVIQGGDACKTLDDYLQMTRDAMDCGVGGVTMGRFVWDYKDVTALVIALRYIIHEGYSVKEAKERELDHDPGLVGGGEDRAQPFDVFRMQPGLLRPGKERDQILLPRRQRIRIETEVARALEIAAGEQPGLIEAVLPKLPEITDIIERAVDQRAVMLGRTDQKPQLPVDREIVRILMRNTNDRLRHLISPELKAHRQINKITLLGNIAFVRENSTVRITDRKSVV